MSPADIAAAELRAGLSRRLAELGLVPPDPAIFRVSALPAPPAPPARRSADRAEGGMSAVAGLQGGARTRPVLRPAAVLAVASASSFLVYLDATIVNVAFPDIRASFAGTTLAGLSWILSAYGIVFAALLVPGGRYADVVGGRRLFLAGLAAFTFGSVLCAAAPSVPLLVAARVLQAAGGALLVPASQLLVMAAFPPEQRMKVIGVMAGVAALASALGPVLGGLMVDLGGWRLVFLVNLPIGLAALALGRRMPAPPPRLARRAARPARLGARRRRGRHARARRRPGARVGLGRPAHDRRVRRLGGADAAADLALRGASRAGARAVAVPRPLVQHRQPRRAAARHELLRARARELALPHAGVGLLRAAGGPGDRARAAGERGRGDRRRRGTPTGSTRAGSSCRAR